MSAPMSMLTNGFEQNIPSKVDGVLFGNTLSFVGLGHFGSLLDQLRVWNSRVIGIVNERGEDTGKLGQRITGNTIRMIVQLFVSLDFNIWCHDATEQFRNRHTHVTGMRKVVEWIVVVGESNRCHEFSELEADTRLENNRIGAEVQVFRCVFGKLDDFLNFIEDNLLVAFISVFPDLPPVDLDFGFASERLATSDNLLEKPF